jgi:hypothetical protein
MFAFKFDRMFVLGVFAALGALLLVALLMLNGLGEQGGKNSYAALANSFLNGQLDTPGCDDVDCAKHNDKEWVVFPPAPALIALPFVALFGPDFSGFIFLALIMSGVTLLLWWRIARALGLEKVDAAWLLTAIAFATPLYYVTLRGDAVWFFAQVVGTLFVTLALHEAAYGRLLRAGIALGIAFLSRQMLILFAPFLFALALRDNERLISFGGAHLRRAFTLALPVLAAVGVYYLYNWARFGDPLDTGYAYIVTSGDEGTNFIGHRIRDIGLFSAEYVPFNLVYLLFEGLHVAFEGDYLTEFAGVSPFGTSLLAASPFVLLAWFVPLRRQIVIGLLCAAVICGVTLFYHNNGFSQYGMQRFTLDWLPVIFFALAMGPVREYAGAFRILALYGVTLNAVTMGAAALSRYV